MSTPNRIVSIYTEDTPNPQAIKFVLNRMLFPQSSADFTTLEEAEAVSPLATKLFKDYDFVSNVFIMNNFVTVTKKVAEPWYELIPDLREAIKTYISEGHTIIDTDAYAKAVAENPSSANPNVIREDDEEVVKKIKEMLTKYVQPAVEGDGGSVVFRSFDQGIVRLGMQGACSGCPSSSITLKSGIEGLLKRMVPEVESVEAEML